MLFLTPSFSATIDINIKGVDDGIKIEQKKDYMEAILSAKLEAIKRSGMKIKPMATVDEMVENLKYIEEKSESVLFPGYQIMDIGYQEDGSYLIILTGKVKTVTESMGTKELRLAKQLFEKGKNKEAVDLVYDIFKTTRDDSILSELMYYQVLWENTPRAKETYEKLKVFYPDSTYVSKLKSVMEGREKEKKRLVAEKEEERKRAVRERDKKKNRFAVKRAKERKKKLEALKKLIGNTISVDDQFYAGDKGVVLDEKTGLMWAVKDNGVDISWNMAKSYCEAYKGGGYTDWRMPTQDELKALYDPNKDYKCKNGYYVHLTELIEITACCPWASETRGFNAANFNFHYGFKYWSQWSGTSSRRILPVRKTNYTIKPNDLK